MLEFVFSTFNIYIKALHLVARKDIFLNGSVGLTHA